MAKKLLTGNEVVIKAARAAGAEVFFGYPITPTTEILTEWAKLASKDKDLIFLQTEDEPSAGFGALGAALGGKKSWTATAALGHVLMQDPLSIAEAMRIPFVLYVGQRGGPSTGTVIYSQQELNLARNGGNGEGMRLVLGPSNLDELFTHTVLAFDWAWRYRLPVIILSDGYLSKMTSEAEIKGAGKIASAYPIVQNGKNPVNIRNCYSQENELAEVLKENLGDFAEVSKKVEMSESASCSDADIIIFAWGSVGNAAKAAVKNLRKEGLAVGLFRPITLKPFPARKAKLAAQSAKTILIAESAAGQFGRLVTESLFGIADKKVERLYKPAEGITAEEIEEKIREISK